MSSSILARCGRHALASRPQLAPATVHFVRFGSGSASSDKKDPPTPQFGKKVVEDDNSQAQLMHDITKGKFEYIGDFAASLNKGPVKLDYGKEAKPLSEKERLQDELNEANLKLIQRSLIIGSLAAAGGCYLGWVVTKWYYGVRNMNEFSDVMKEKMPKVSGSMEDSMIGRVRAISLATTRWLVVFDALHARTHPAPLTPAAASNRPICPLLLPVHARRNSRSKVSTRATPYRRMPSSPTGGARFAASSIPKRAQGLRARIRSRWPRNVSKSA